MSGESKSRTVSLHVFWYATVPSSSSAPVSCPAREMLRRLASTSLRAHRISRVYTSARPLQWRGYATPTAQPPSPNDPFATGNNTYYVEEMYRIWKEDPKAVHASWDVYFSGLDSGVRPQDAFTPPPTLQSLPTPTGGTPTLHSLSGSSKDLSDHLKVSQTARPISRRHRPCLRVLPHAATTRSIIFIFAGWVLVTLLAC